LVPIRVRAARPPCAANEPSAQGGAVEAIHAAHQAFNVALEKADVETLDKLIAKTYAFTDPNGRVTDKKGVVEGVRTGIISIRSQEVRDVTVHVYGNSAVETGELAKRHAKVEIPAARFDTRASGLNATARGRPWRSRRLGLSADNAGAAYNCVSGKLIRSFLGLLPGLNGFHKLFRA
jgi:hypothetical protein